MLGPGEIMNRTVGLVLQSVKAAFAFKLRAVFCVISVAMGIAAVSLIVAATEGAYQKAYEIVDMFGPDSIMIVGGNDEAKATGKRTKTLTLDDAAAIEESFPGTYMVNPVSSVGMVTVFLRDVKYTTYLVGTGSGYSVAWSWPVAQGTDLSPEDIRRAKNVGLIGRHLADELFKDKDPVGNYIFVKRLPVRIIGILEPRGVSPRGHNLDNRLIMPVSTVMKKFLKEKKYISMIRTKFVDQKNLDYYADELSRFLRQRHKIPPGESDDFTIITPKEIVKFLVALTGSLLLFLGISGMMTLIVAGVVLANLFLLSVKERSKEIGIRRSVGARQRDILFQFLGESLLLTTIGGIIGFVLGIIASRFLMMVARFPIHFSWKAFAAGLIMSWLIGVFFALKPSLQAARLNPIEAIRE